MAKSLCKYRRAEIGDQFVQISRIVSAPKFVCRSCARSASEKGYLCKPSSIQLPKGGSAVAKAGAPVSASVVALAAQEVAESPLADRSASLGKKQRKKLKKLAKQKNKRLKKAAKAVKRYEKARYKAKRSMKLA